MKKKTLLIFDLDGTVIDSAGNIRECTNAGFRKHGFKEVSNEEVEPFIGHDFKQYFPELLKLQGVECSPELIEDLSHEFIEYSAMNPIEETSIYSGLKELFEKLDDQYILAIGTTKHSERAALILELLNFAKPFELIQGTDQFPCKPEPDIIYLVQEKIQKMGYQIDKTYMIGDTILDMKAGKNAGVSTVLVDYGFDNKQNQEVYDYADHIIKNPKDLLSYL